MSEVILRSRHGNVYMARLDLRAQLAHRNRDHYLTIEASEAEGILAAFDALERTTDNNGKPNELTLVVAHVCVDNGEKYHVRPGRLADCLDPHRHPATRQEFTIETLRHEAERAGRRP